MVAVNFDWKYKKPLVNSSKLGYEDAYPSPVELRCSKATSKALPERFLEQPRELGDNVMVNFVAFFALIQHTFEGANFLIH